MSVETKEAGRGRWTFDDWHHERCGGRCEKNFCRAHRRLFWECQDFEEDRSVGWFGGDGECIWCKSPNYWLNHNPFAHFG